MNNKEIKKAYHKARRFYYGNAIARRIIKRNLSEPKYEKPVMTAKEGNDTLKAMIESGEPFAAGRYGGTEAKTIADVLYTKAGGKCGGVSEKTLQRIMTLSGFFPADQSLLVPFTDLYMEEAPKMDLLGVWNIVMQSFLADHAAVNAKLSELRVFEPYYFDNPWSKALEGKKVLVVHPFAKTIESQYAKRQQLFANENILPEFQLRVVKAVQTLAGETDSRFKTWFEALDYMYAESIKEDFDIALIGCGAYGFPLATKLKEYGKQAIHIGGSLQLLFGIKGSRWDNHEIIGKLYNDAWVRPGQEDQIRGGNAVEGSCYW